MTNIDTTMLAAIELLRDKSFIASLRVAERSVYDAVVAYFRKCKICKGSIEEKIDDLDKLFRQHSEEKAQANLDNEQFDPEIEKQAKELLRDPNIVERFLCDIAKDGLIGEILNAVLILLIVVSRKSLKPIHAVLKAASSSGKNFLVGKVLAYLSENDKKEISDMSPKALQYLTEGIQHKVIVIAEAEGSVNAEYSLRTFMSEGNLKIWVAEKNNVTGQIETREHIVEGPVCIITTTTSMSLHDENETRTIEITLDESKEQTDRINKAQAKQAMDPISQEQQLQAENRQILWQCVLSLLKQYPVKIPQAAELANSFPKSRIRARRDFPKLITIIESHTLLHQFQREIIDGQLVATDLDVQAAKDLCQSLTKSISPRYYSLYKRLKQELKLDEFTVKQAATALGYSPDAMRRNLSDLESYELVEKKEESKGSKAAKWKVIDQDSHLSDLFDNRESRTNVLENKEETPLCDCAIEKEREEKITEKNLEILGHHDSENTVGQTPLFNNINSISPTKPKVGQSRTIVQTEEVEEDHNN